MVNYGTDTWKAERERERTRQESLPLSREISEHQRQHWGVALYVQYLREQSLREEQGLDISSSAARGLLSIAKRGFWTHVSNWENPLLALLSPLIKRGSPTRKQVYEWCKACAVPWLLFYTSSFYWHMMQLYPRLPGSADWGLFTVEVHRTRATEIWRLPCQIQTKRWDFEPRTVWRESSINWPVWMSLCSIIKTDVVYEFICKQWGLNWINVLLPF